MAQANEDQEKLNEAVGVMNRSLQEVNIQNMNVQLVAQMFKNYQSNVLFHLEGKTTNEVLPARSNACQLPTTSKIRYRLAVEKGSRDE